LWTTIKVFFIGAEAFTNTNQLAGMGP